jgi:tRNA (uracil-5-)-methyltransferase
MSVHQVQPSQYQTLLSAKAVKLRQQLAEFLPPELSVFDSPDSHYRMRAEFKVWHEGDTAQFAMYKPGEYRKPYIIDDFPVANQYINDLMPQLLIAVNKSELLRQRLFQAEFLSSQTGNAVITLIYHKFLTDEWQTEAKSLAKSLKVDLIGRSKKQKRVIGKDYVEETLRVNDREYHYQQVEASFTQPNAAVCEKMLSWAVSNVDQPDTDLLELYCGNGNFTVALAAKFRKILATEISKTSVNSARINFAKNSVHNAVIARMSSEEFSDAMDGARQFKRLKDIDLNQYDFSTVLVDPPRAGLDQHTEAMVCRFDRILYVSCNPDTLRKNLQHICQTHAIKKFALFDQFPYTHHIECGVILEKK